MSTYPKQYVSSQTVNPSTPTFGEFCPGAFQIERLSMCRNWPYRPFHARWIGEGHAELKDDNISMSTTCEFRQRVKAETTWTEVPSSKPTWDSLHPEEKAKIAKELKDCPACSGGATTKVYTGEDTGIEIAVSYRCPCHSFIRLTSEWKKSVPERFRQCRLSTLEPSPLSKLSMPGQQKVIDILKANPSDSYLLCGDAGVGKTHMSFALHWHALLGWVDRVHAHGVYYPAVLRASVPELLLQSHAYAMRGDDTRIPAPDITIGKIKSIKAEGTRPTIILDELDKVGNVTQAKLSFLFGIVDACYQANGQLIATSNIDGDTLRRLWSKDQDESSAQLADAIVRRCGDDQGAHTLILRRPVA
jgi:hypothetical protein